MELQETKGLLELVIERLDNDTQIEIAQIRERSAAKKQAA
jgi:hypothetical protein